VGDAVSICSEAFDAFSAACERFLLVIVDGHGFHGGKAVHGVWRGGRGGGVVGHSSFHVDWVHVRHDGDFGVVFVDWRTSPHLA